MFIESKHSLKKYHLSENWVGALGAFSKGVSWIIEDCKEFTSIAQNQEEGKTLKEEITQAAKENEVVAATDASWKDEHMKGIWITEYDFEIESDKNIG